MSVAMATYNGARFLNQQLDSIAAQTRLPHELVVCDDGSTDATVAILEAFSARAPFRVQVQVNDRQLGSSQNFAKAIALCAGTIIVLADQDDVWRPHKLERLGAALAQHPEAGLVFSDAELVDEALQPFGARLWQRVGFGAEAQHRVRTGRALEVLLRRLVVTGATMAFRATYKEAVLPVPAEYSWVHDAWIALMIASLGQLAFVPEPLILYRQHDDNQIGVRGQDFGARLAGARGRDRSFRRALVEQHRLACAHLRGLGGHGYRLHPGTLEQLEEKRRHLEARASLPASLHGKLNTIVREAATRRYFRYSSGLYSVAEDLIFS